MSKRSAPIYERSIAQVRQDLPLAQQLTSQSPETAKNTSWHTHVSENRLATQSAGRSSVSLLFSPHPSSSVLLFSFPYPAYSPMASSSAFSVLPLIGYALLAGLIAYLSVRLFRHFKSRTRISASTALPKPVSGAAAKGTFPLGRTTGWDWSRWTLPTLPRVPWARVPSIPMVVRGTSSKNTKNLSVDLLPTTALPPPPSSAPIHMPTPQLVDIGPPPTPALTAASTSGGHLSSFPASPRTPSPPHHVSPQYSLTHSHPSKHLVQTSHSRPPSPHALLATTVPQKHAHQKRSRSLGGVPVRRLSGGMASALRNAVALEMQDFSHGKMVRDTSREHLLIDFESSGTTEDVEDVSPAASDIGVLPLNPHAGYERTTALPVRVDARRVGRHVLPLVDLGDDEVPESGSWKEDPHVDDGWKWFDAKTSAAQSAHPLKAAGAVEFVKTHKLVDVESGSDARAELVSEAQPVHVRRVETLVDLEDNAPEVLVDVSEKMAPTIDNTAERVREMPLVELAKEDVAETRLVDVESGEYEHRDDWRDEHAHTYEPANDHTHDLYEYMNPRPDPPAPAPLPALSSAPERVHVKAAFSHPLEDVELVSIDARPEPVAEEGLLFAQDGPEEQQPQMEPLVEVGDSRSTSPIPSPAFSHPPSPLPLPSSSMDQALESSHWSWGEVDVDDPWNNHVIAPSASAKDSDEPVSSSDLITFEGSTGRADDAVVEEVLLKSPAPSLGATLLDEEEEVMPALDLEGGSGDYEAVHEEQTSDAARGQEVLADVSVEEEQDGDETPKATPASVHLDLPAWDLEELDAVYEAPVAQEVREEESSAEYPDPDLLPLPLETLAADAHLAVPFSLSSPTKADAEQVPEKVEVEDEDHLAQFVYIAERDTKKASNSPLSQTPTPPASPPPISTTHLRIAKSASGSSSRAISPISPVPRLAVLVPAVPSLALSAAMDEGDKENATPTALSALNRPAWSLRAQDSPALGLPSSGLVTGASPRARRRVLADVSADMNVEGEIEAEVEEKMESPKVEEKEERLEEPSVEKTLETAETTTPSAAIDGSTEKLAIQAPQIKPSTSLPGAFPEATPPSKVEFLSSSPTSSTVATTATPTRRQRALSVFTIPSARTLVRSPLDIALAMQLRPGLGAGADPAWMVRFLMSMYGWLAIVIAGGGEF